MIAGFSPQHVHYMVRCHSLAHKDQGITVPLTSARFTPTAGTTSTIPTLADPAKPISRMTPL
jgi:hypothetical protein